MSCMQCMLSDMQIIYIYSINACCHMQVPTTTYKLYIRFYLHVSAYMSDNNII